MAKKKKPEEHENLERWLVSYADFMTLLFATFVVLYALAQTDVSELSKIDESLQRAFSNSSILQGQDSILESGENLFDQSNGNSFIQELMTEYISPKYETQSFEQIEKSVDEMIKSGELQGVDVTITKEGLLITFDERYLFAPGSADLNISSKKLLDKVGVLVVEKFMMHSIRVEGHTDSSPISSAKFPSNWELSGARACSVIRYMINRFKLYPNLFTAVGYADTRPAKSKNNKKTISNSRRVEIIILRNKYNGLDKTENEIINKPKEEQIALQTQRKAIVEKIKNENHMNKNYNNNSNQKITEKELKKYATSKGISLDNKALYNSIEKSKVEKKKIEAEKKLPDSEDMEL